MSGLEEGASMCANCGAAVEANQAEPAITDSFSVPSFTMIEDLEGVGGWLILVAVGLAIAPLLLLRTILLVNIQFLYAARYQDYLTGHPAVAGLAALELITNVILLVLVAVLNYLFFSKKKVFPTYMIFYLFLQLFLLLADCIALHLMFPSADLTSNYAALAHSLLVTSVWTPYYIRSRRVKATFIH